MSFCIVHLSDPHFGGEADISLIRAVEELVPDLEPRVIALTGDLTQRARHGEFQAARLFVHELERTAPVYVIPGNHDVQWWWRPLVPAGRDAKYRKYRQYFGPSLTPTLQFPEAVMAGALTSHGVAWGSLTLRVRDVAVKGHLPASQLRRVSEIFEASDPGQARILVLHHNVLRGELSQRMGLARWRLAQRRLLACGAEIILCGHDHQVLADTLGEQVVVSCAGSLSRRSRGNRPPVFNRITIEEESIQVELYGWERTRQLFRRTDVYTFPRPSPTDAKQAVAASG